MSENKIRLIQLRSFGISNLDFFLNSVFINDDPNYAVQKAVNLQWNQN